MRRVWKGAAVILATATALGLTRPSAALSSPPVPDVLVTDVSADPEDDAPPLPRVVPPTAPARRPTLSPLIDAQITTVAGGQTPSESSPRPTVDLLTPPALPPAWSRQPNPPPLAVLPSGLPAAPIPRYSAAVPGTPFPLLLTRFFMPSQAAADPSADAVLQRLPTTRVAAHPQAAPPTVPASIAASNRPAGQPTKVGPAARTWPPAFVTRDESRPPQVQAAGYAEKSSAPAPATEAPIRPDQLKQRIEAVCGRGAVNVVATTLKDGNVQVRVRVRDAAAEQEMANKILELPEMTVPAVHLVLEVEP